MTYQITGTTVINSGRCLTNIANATASATGSTYVCTDANGCFCVTWYYASLSSALPGTNLEGGYLLCRNGGVAWIVAPCTAEVSRTFANIANANTVAQQVSGCTGWFVPTQAQLQNPGYRCLAGWDSFSATSYWSTTNPNGPNACALNFSTGTGGTPAETTTLCVRSFRCVTY